MFNTTKLSWTIMSGLGIALSLKVAIWLGIATILGLAAFYAARKIRQESTLMKIVITLSVLSWAIFFVLFGVTGLIVSMIIGSIIGSIVAAVAARR